jgi:hypothetical protein
VERTFRDVCGFLGMEFRGSLGACSGSLAVKENTPILEKAFRMGAGI